MILKCLKIWHVSGLMEVALREFCCSSCSMGDRYVSAILTASHPVRPSFTVAAI